jgi:hypothetical protein
VEKNTAATPIPDPLETLVRELRRKMQEAHPSTSVAYEAGVLSGLHIALELVEREQERLREIDDEHVPRRVYGPHSSR